MKNFKKIMTFAALLSFNVIPMLGMMQNISTSLPQVPVAVLLTSSDSVTTPEPEAQNTAPEPAEEDITKEKKLTEQEQENIDSYNYWRNKCEQEATETLKNLEQALQDQNEEQQTRIMTHCNFRGRDMLEKALKSPTLNYDLIQLLLDNGTTLYEQDIRHLVKADNVEFIQFLIDHHFAIYHYRNDSSSSLIMRNAINDKAFNIVKCLCNNNTLTDIDKNNALDCALRQSEDTISHDIIKFLLEHGARLTDMRRLWKTPQDLLPLLFNYPMDQEIKDAALHDSCRDYWKISDRKDTIKLLLAHGAVPTQLMIVNTLYATENLDITELLLQHPAITVQIKNDLLDRYSYCDTKMQLLIKYGAQVSQKELIDAIKRNNYQKVKLFLESGAVQATKEAVSAALSSNDSSDIISLLFEHGAPIPLTAERKLLHHKKNATIAAKILSEAITREKNRINQAPDLTETQKKNLLQAYDQLNFLDIFTKNDYNSLTQEPIKFHIPEKLLLKYFPLGLWINNMHNFSQFLQILLNDRLNPFETNAPQTLQDIQKNMAIKKGLTVTEILLMNLATQRKALGENAIFSGQDPNDKYNEKYYSAGFAGDIVKTKIIDQITQAEKELQTQGFETFFSGRNWEWNFVNDVWNMLTQIKTGENNPDKISLRFRDQNCDVATLQTYRKDLIKNGAAYHIGTGTDKNGKESEVTFMNKTVLSNPGYYGECTGTYFIDNRSVAKENTGWKIIEKLFKQHDLQSYFEQNKDTLKALYDQHQKTNDFGEILCIAVRNDSVDQMVYPAKSGGYKRSLSASSNIQYLKRNALTSKKFLDTNHTFYCLAVSDMPSEYGTKYTIKSLHLADPEKYEVYKQARDAFAAKMKADLQMSAQG